MTSANVNYNSLQRELLQAPIKHIDIKTLDTVSIVDSMSHMAFQARNLARAAQIYEQMIAEKDCAVILCLAGSLISAGLKKVIFDMLDNNMVDAIVSTGANIVDQDFFEGLGYKHYKGTPAIDDNALREAHIDRIYDTFINEDELRVCDHTIARICDELPARAYSSREFIREMGAYLKARNLGKDSIVRLAYEKAVPIFVPAFSDCSAGFGLVLHQWNKKERALSIDSGKDFLELTKVKLAVKESGLFMVGGGVPKNFAQDTVVAAELLDKNAPMHKYAVQITVADERDGALSGSTLREANSWGKVDTTFEQMVFSEATIAMPLIVGYVYQKGSWKKRQPLHLAKTLA